MSAAVEDDGDFPVPETHVLAVASHVVFGYVGNTMAVSVMQALGCEVAALNTVQYSNHTGYKQWRGTKTSAEEIRDHYEGLKHNYLNDFDLMLTGYIPTAEAVAAVGTIARDLKLKASIRPGSFFWALDPVMGDNGQLYIDEAVVPAYKALLPHVDMIVPNQFEAELLSDAKITSLETLSSAVSTLHRTYGIPHIIVTSVRFDAASPTFSLVGSTARSDFSARIFRIEFPAIDCQFQGTGDMFAALILVRLREAVLSPSSPSDSTTSSSSSSDPSSHSPSQAQQPQCRTPLRTTKSWMSPDDVRAAALPLATAAKKVLASMQAILARTKAYYDRSLNDMATTLQQESSSEKRLHLRRTRAAEVQLVRNTRFLLYPPSPSAAVKDRPSTVVKEGEEGEEEDEEEEKKEVGDEKKKEKDEGEGPTYRIVEV